ncbi:MAG: hypothetical protein D6806_09925, partial [Deltaproteobacteria bacterium]
LAHSVLWLDAPRLAELCFVSNALLKPRGPHRRLLMSERTARVAGENPSGSVLVTPFFRHFVVGGLKLELAPSGHMPGAAQLRVEGAGSPLVYTGDFDTRQGLCAERIHFWKARRLVLRVHYGLDGELFPDRQAERQRLLEWAEGKIAARSSPVLLYTHPATAMELLVLLGQAGLRPWIHRSLHELAGGYARAGVALPQYRKSRPARDIVPCIWPLRLRKSSSLVPLPRRSFALASGEAARPDAKRIFDVPEAFCISCRADRRGTMEIIEASGARKIYLSGRRAEPVARWLAGKGLDARLLAPPRQMWLFGERGIGHITDDPERLFRDNIGE